jgi:uncharacterized protein YciI
MALASIIAALLLVQTPAKPASPEPQLQMKTFQFVFLMAGEPAKGTEEEQQKRFQGHLAHLESLWLKENKAVLVGPVNDPHLRGIIVLDVSAEEAKKLVAADPFVAAGQLKAVIRPLFAAAGLLRKPAKITDLEEYTLGFYMRPAGELPKLEEEEGKRLMEGHLANNDKMWKDGALVWAGPFGQGEGLDPAFRGLILFRLADQAKIESLIAQDPLVRKGRLQAKLYKAYVAKGVWPDPPKN